MSADDDILFARQGGLGLVTLNRPHALNTLTLDTFRRLEPQLIVWEADPGVRALVLQGAGERAFCAGGDVVAVYEARNRPPGPDDYKAAFFREEYRAIRRVHRYPKPTIALIDGITMGGGAGISINGTYRVASERTLIAMPEVAIGLFPDVGATRFLNLCPGRTGLFLALTGARIRAADALYCGFATHHVPHDRMDGLRAALAASTEAADIAAVLDAFHTDPGPAPLAPIREAIDRVFALPSVEAIRDALAGEDAEWARTALHAIAQASPLSLELTFRQLELGRGMSLEEALALEYRMTRHIMTGHDFFEGVRALLVDKDRQPRWQHASLEAVGADEVASCFVGVGADELRFD
jgi:enoyl-CoA hydratase